MKLTLNTKRERDFWEQAYLAAVASVEYTASPSTVADAAVIALRERMPGPGEVPESHGE